MTWLIYDGDCPFCANYVAWKDAKSRIPGLELLDARQHPSHPAIRAVAAQGLRLDDGMALVEEDGTVLHGAQVMARLSGSSSPMANEQVAGLVYPWLRRGRNLALKLLRREKLGY